MGQPNADRCSALSKNDYLLAGSISGFVSRAIVQPLDVLKIRFQLQVEPISSSCTGKYHGFVQAIRCISKEEGAVAFWKGHIPAQLQAVGFSSLQFLTFEVLVSWLVQLNVCRGSPRDPRVALKSSTTLETFVCGSLAGSVAAAVTQPLDVLRTRFIAQGEPKLYRSVTHAALYITSHEGIPGFFRGLVPSLLLVAPQTGLQFAIYHTFNQLVETVRQGLKGRASIKISTKQTDHSFSGPFSDLDAKKIQHGEPYRVGTAQSLISGGLAGMGSKCIIYPLDMIKKRMQIHGFEEARVRFGRVPVSGSVRNCLVSIWNTEGASALFKGLRPTLLKSCVSISCRFTVYEQLCRLIYYTRNSENRGRAF